MIGFTLFEGRTFRWWWYSYDGRCCCAGMSVRKADGQPCRPNVQWVPRRFDKAWKGRRELPDCCRRKYVQRPKIEHFWATAHYYGEYKAKRHGALKIYWKCQRAASSLAVCHCHCLWMRFMIGRWWRELTTHLPPLGKRACVSKW